MLHSLHEFLKQYGLVVDVCLLTTNLAWIVVMLWRRSRRLQLEVILSGVEPGDGRLAITITNRSGKEVVIRRLGLDIYSDSLNRHKLAELRRQVVLRKNVAEHLTPGQSAMLVLDHRSPERDEVHPLSYRELVSDLDVLEVEIAQLTGFVWDENGQPYRSNAVRLPVYQLVSSNDTTGLAEPQTTVI